MKQYLFCVIFTFIIPLLACQTIHKNEKEEAKRKEILASQKSLIVSFLNKGVPSMALKELRRLMVIHPKDPDFLNLMGLTQLALENPSQASKYFKESYKQYPRTSVALNLSSAYIESGHFQKAVEFLKKIKEDSISENYQYPERLFHNMGLASERNEDLHLAEKYYNIALSENPNYYLSLMRLGLVYERVQKPIEAQKSFSRAKSACPKCFDPVNALAMRFIATGESKKAYIVLKRYINKTEISDENRNKAEKLLSMVKKISNAKSRSSSSQIKNFGKNNKNLNTPQQSKTF